MLSVTQYPIRNTVTLDLPCSTTRLRAETAAR